MAKQHAEAEADVAAAAAAALLTSLPLALALPQCVCAVLPLLPLLVMLRRISARFTFCVVPSTAADVAS